jgi:hypothetical protein
VFCLTKLLNIAVVQNLEEHDLLKIRSLLGYGAINRLIMEALRISETLVYSIETHSFIHFPVGLVPNLEHRAPSGFL